MIMAGRLIAALAALGIASASSAGEPDAKGLEFFEKKVRPLLVERCYSCHSSQAKKLRGGLLLDSRAGWTKGGDSGPVIVPGDPDQSAIVRAVTYADPELQMPPKGKLPDEEIAAIRDWVSMGAPDPRTEAAPARARKVIDIASGRRHWAFLPLREQMPPAVRDASWCRTPIDSFISAKLDEKGLASSKQAEKRQLLRRAYFDLHGLPPAPEDVEAFVLDRSENAYEKVIDRLLANPRYGERWARYWLDLARFAESHGFEHDTDRPTAYHYRDSVIEALNQDVPYDTFVKWQLAGDELAPANNLALKATGFLAAGTHSTQITANQVEKERYDELDDMANITGTAMLGLTIGCARCHDHKFDPIPQDDYYRLLATFTTTVRSEVDLNLDPEGFAHAQSLFDKEHAPLVAAVAAFERDRLPARLAEWEKHRSCSVEQPVWLVLEPTSMKSKSGATFAKQPDGSALAGGKNADFDTYHFVAETDRTGITAVRLEALADSSLAKGGPGRAANGNFDLTDFRLAIAPKSGGSPSPVAFRNPRSSFDQPGLPITAAIDANPKSGWAVDPQFGKNHAAVFELTTPSGHECGTVLEFALDFQGNAGHNIGRVRLAISTAPIPAPLDGPAMPQAIAKILDTPTDKRTSEERQSLVTWYRALDREWQKLQNAVDEHAHAAPKPKLAKAMISTEGLPAVRLHTQGADFLEKTHFLKRGDPNQKQAEATQAFLQVLAAVSDPDAHWRLAPPRGWRTSFRRASLASWITDVDAGAGRLLARVIVNRIWQHHMGRGIVTTPSDFGTQGERPAHPELLDWLAGELIRGGWRLKPIHRLIMTSAVYLQESRGDSSRAAVDHDNTLFWRQSRHRLEAEAIRDAMLAAGGVLDERMYGPGTLDESQRRRSIYFTVKRSKLIPMMVLFDAPDALQGIGARSSTTIAPQALLLMNNPIVRDWAAAFARRVSPAPSVDSEQAIRAAYATALTRPPSDGELADGVTFLAQQLARYQSDGKPNARELALTDFCQVLMNLNEFIYIE
jgi:mono/diheme cytochrome c family protein